MSTLKKLLVFFVDDDKKKDQLLKNLEKKKQDNDEKKIVSSVAKMIILELPWGWEIIVSQNLYQDHEFGKVFHKLLDAVQTNGKWFAEDISSYSGFWRIIDLGDMHKNDISRVFTELGLDWDEKDLRNNIIKPSKTKKDSIEEQGLEPVKKKTRIGKPYFDRKMASAGEKENDH